MRLAGTASERPLGDTCTTGPMACGGGAIGRLAGPASEMVVVPVPDPAAMVTLAPWSGLNGMVAETVPPAARSTAPETYAMQVNPSPWYP